ncbi:MAG: hypothetical protein LC723_02490 [Actinobacteria bacterium]|nr:hypothetical protein [Actinomycetota bacterium]
MAGLVVGASFLPAAFLATLMVAIASVTAFGLGRSLIRRSLPIRKQLAVVLVVLFVLLAAYQQEPGLLLGATVALMVMASAYMSGRVEARSVPAFASSVLLVFYIGFDVSYLALIRGLDAGPRLVSALVVMIVSFRIARNLVPGGGSLVIAPGSGSELRWLPAAAGVAASILGAAISVTFLNSALGVFTTIILGALVGLASAIGELGAGLLMSSDGHPSRGLARDILEQVVPALLAAPAFFYGIRLYLT